MIAPIKPMPTLRRKESLAGPLTEDQKERAKKMELIRQKLKDRKITEYESDTIERYEMLSEEFDYEQVRNNENFVIKRYKDSLYRGEANPETKKRSGRGVMVYDSGRIYEGTWQQDKRHG